MDKKKIIQRLANQAGISFAKTVAILRKMSAMKEVKSRLKEEQNDNKR